jgi:hypothetical protein
MASRKLKPAPPLWKLVCRAVEIIQQERDDLVDSYTCRADDHIEDALALKYLRRYDRWLKDARAELLRRES